MIDKVFKWKSIGFPYGTEDSNPCGTGLNFQLDKRRLVLGSSSLSAKMRRVPVTPS